MNPALFFAAAVAGGVGAGLRYVVDLLVSGADRARFPSGIFLVNVTGSLALGVLTGLGAGQVGSATAWVVGAGLLGGYTTFSTVSAESVLMMRAGESRRGWMNAMGTVLAGVASASVGLCIGGLL